MEKDCKPTADLDILRQKAEKFLENNEPIKKTGYMAVSAATMMILLSSPSQAQSSEPAPPPDKPNKPSGGGPWKRR